MLNFRQNTKRGIVAAPRVTAPLKGSKKPLYQMGLGTCGTTTVIDGVKIDFEIVQEDLNRYLFYWDKILVPSVTFIDGIEEAGYLRPYFKNEAEIEFLEGKSIFSIENIHLPAHNNGKYGYPAADIFSDAQVKLSNLLKDDQQNIWSFAQIGYNLRGTALSHNVHAVEIKLYDVLPSPTDNTPFEDILNFKEKKKGDLVQLRHALDGLRLSILSSPDDPDQIKRSIERIEASLHDINQLVNESFKERVVSTMSLYLNIPSSAALTALGAYLLPKYGIPTEFGALTGLGLNASFMFARASDGLLSRLPDRSKDFVYLYHAHRSRIV